MVAIKNMKMPSCCWSIKKNGKSYECPIYRACANRKPLVPNCKPNNCPLVEIEEPKTGHWIYDYTSADGHRTYHCSECGCYLQPKHSEPLNSFKWCSLCGADMREAVEE